MIGLVVVKSIAVVLWALASAKAGLVTAAQEANGPDFINVILNFASLGILVAGLFLAPKAMRARAAQAQLAEKDQIIATAEQLREIREEEVAACKDRMRDIGFELDAAQKFEAHWRGRYEEQKKYTAEGALETIQSLLETTNVQAERRHQEMLAALKRIPVPGELTDGRP
jgi:ABC-type multidrug transport system fused ATPase/permease subunit